METAKQKPFDQFHGDYGAYLVAKYPKPELNEKALKNYWKEVKSDVIEHPSKPKLTLDVMWAIIKYRSSILFRLKGEEGRSFRIIEGNEKAVRAVCLYAMKSPLFESEGHGKLHKSLMLCGLTGCGKTTLMRVFADAGIAGFRHDGSEIKNIADVKQLGWGDGIHLGMFRLSDIHHCIGIHHEYKRDGEKSMNKYMTSFGANTNARPKVFDDLGSEETDAKNYGNRTNVMEIIINDRHNAFQEFGLKTHFSSNIVNSDQIEEMYGVRIKDRLREMTNQIFFTSKAEESFRKDV